MQLPARYNTPRVAAAPAAARPIPKHNAMKRLFIFAAFALALNIAPAAAQEPEAPAPAAAATEAAATDAVQMMQNCIDELRNALSSVSDKESADAAAESIEALAGKFSAAEEALAAAELSEDEQQRLAMQMLSSLLSISAMGEKLSQVNFYGSEKMRDALSTVFGADEEEGDEEETAAEGDEEAAADFPAPVYQLMDILVDVQVTLEGVKDKESADAAAVALAELHRRSDALKPEFDAAVAELNDNAKSAMAIMMLGTVAATANVVEELSQNDYHGSEALKNEINQLDGKE